MDVAAVSVEVFTTGPGLLTVADGFFRKTRVPKAFPLPNTPTLLSQLSVLALFTPVAA